MHLIFLSLLAACGGKDDTGAVDSGDDTGTDQGCAGDDAACGDGQICEEDTCVDGDRNNAVDEAEAIVWDVPVTGVINPADDADYYAFTAEGGEYVRVETVLTTDEGDTVVSLRDPAGKVVTSADAFATGTGVTGVDAVAFAYLADAGTYTIRVEDVGTASGEGGSGSPDYGYTLTLQEWEDTTGETDSAESPSATIDLSDERIWNSLGALLETAGDSDWITVSFPLDGQNLYVDGNEDLTGSDLSPVVRLWNADGTLLGEKSAVGPDEYLLGPHLAAGSYLVEIADAGGGGGANDWAFLHFISRADTEGYEFTEDVEPGSTSDDAVALPLTDYENGSGLAYSQAQGLGWIDAADDEDWFVIPMSYDKGGMVVCLASSFYGSLTAPTIELYDASLTLVASAEGTTVGVPTAHLDNVDAAPGSWFLRVTGGADGGTGLGAWYRFYWYTASFAISDYADGGYACP